MSPNHFMVTEPTGEQNLLNFESTENVTKNRRIVQKMDGIHRKIPEFDCKVP